LSVATFTALYDACVLYPAPLRDLLLEFALTDLVRAKWSSHIHDEWIRAVLEDRPDLTAMQLRRTRDLMDLHARDCLVEDFEELIPSLTLPDPNDRHVLAAAICGRADVIVTYNLTDFPDKALQKYGITPQHPDEFLLHLFNLAPSIVCAAARTHRARLKHPPKTTAEYLETLERQSLTQLVAALRPYVTRL
jgi:predicted nucleic acid-binding protein